jgi:hypothetical protein
LTIDWKDFEDAIQYSTATSNQLDAIVTRNPKDFESDPGASPQIVTPEQLIQAQRQ